MVASNRLLPYALWALLICLLGLSNAQDAPECSASLPCTAGCCSKFGFCGLGPDYCSKDVCVNNCDRKADCDPGGYGKDYVLKTTCPLNVCCSKYGFCGTTKEFCGTKTVRRPSCDIDQKGKFKRVVGYYESWATGRPCNRIYPEQIPSDIYSHINFAFASIDPTTFELVPADVADIDLYKRVANLKAKDINLKVLISVGGWTFNDPGPTATTFSDIARDETAQRKFIDSVLRFLQTYNFDGIDIDWEYPEAEDRSGRGEDFANFPKFMKNIKQTLKSYEVSVTLPASFWYLQHFDLKNLAPHVDFFNILTYDFHGVWDKLNKWVGPYLNSHTNLTEIKDGLDLLWRNGIDHDKVSLGLAFYGRGFIASSPTCLEPGCTFESGTDAQSCSAEVGVLLNSEIDGLVAEQNLKPVLNKDAAVKILTWGGNNWLTYDDEETLQMKADFARSECLGGVMVWAISHDTQDMKYSNALSGVAPRLFNSKLYRGSVGNGDNGYVTDETDYQQCRWTGCNEDCPGDWIRMMRKDDGARRDEFMVNGAGCGGYGEHKLCCPPSANVPTCGWYSHRNGNCDNGESCPAGTKEIGSNSEYCHPSGFYSPIRSYQAACCTTDTDSMVLYSQCDWSAKVSLGNWPDCSKSSCSNDVVAYSGDGSGEATCWGAWYEQLGDSQKNKYCCDQPDDNKKWSDCEWQGKTDIIDEDTGLHICTGECSGGLIMVAAQQAGCSGGGAEVRCCKPSYKSLQKRYQNSEDDEFAYYLKRYMENPFCSANIFNSNGLRKRIDSPVSDLAVTASNGTVIKRQFSPDIVAQDYAEKMAEELFIGTPRQSTIDIWDNTVVPYFDNLSYANLHDYQMGAGRNEFLQYGSTQWPWYITCNMATLQIAMSGNGGDSDPGSGSCTTTCVCVRADCCSEDDSECINSSEDGYDTVSKRAAKNYDWTAFDYRTGARQSLPWRAPDYPSPSNLNKIKERSKFAESYTYDPNCASFRPVVVDSLQDGKIVDGFESKSALNMTILVSGPNSVY
ncbi:hypothetical protein VE01_07296 [Pseudogymnoascus verrucosus]|uniref:chitinase n=1 Tax=Pseudogymnoascus verrucosus TaxID=342668 RepID=A0A1B8GH46_9PEZI|nr:uncharacterized protein VE01_07296 [Pseudogymnoascus verrucosus]OBT95158.1 hypothetical protein VE01_07296 [Pseudogymnoascus verrucosus]